MHLFYTLGRPLIRDVFFTCSTDCWADTAAIVQQIGNRNFRKKTKQNIANERTPQIVHLVARLKTIRNDVIAIPLGSKDFFREPLLNEIKRSIESCLLLLLLFLLLLLIIRWTR